MNVDGNGEPKRRILNMILQGKVPFILRSSEK